MKRKIFSILLTLVLVCSFSLVTAVPAGAVEPETVVLGGDVATAVGAQTTDESHIGSGCWQAAPSGQIFEGKMQLYIDPTAAPFSLGEFTIADIASISYWTNKPGAQGDVDFYLAIYTTQDEEDDGSWYGYRLNAEPYFSDSLNAPANDWNQWNTDVGTNQLTFFDEAKIHSLGFYTQPTLQDLQDGTINWFTYNSAYEDQEIDYGAETVMCISFQTGTGWNDDLLGGYIDAITISLNGGASVTIDLEEYYAKVWVDDDSLEAWYALPGNFEKIQDGIDNVAPAGTVNVAAGTYYEHILIDEALTVRSTDGAEVTIINSNAYRYKVTIQHSDVTFEGFTVTDPNYAAGSDATGILIHAYYDEDVSNVQILDNIITQVRSETGTPSTFGSVGINVGYAKTKGNTLSNIVISGNTITDIKNPEGGASDHTCGINVWDGAEDVVISNNTISDIKYNGIILEHASNVRIENNPIITRCETGIRVAPYEGVSVSGLTVNSNYFADNVIQVFDGAAKVLNIQGVLDTNDFDRAVTVDHDASLLHTIWSSIQDGIDNASPDDTINVAAGTYAGAVVDKSVTVSGAEGGASVITSGVPYKVGNPALHTAFRPDADGAEIRNFTINCNVEDDLDLGVYAVEVDDVIVDFLTINDGTIQGISNWGGSDWVITNNVITDTVALGGGGIGIFLGAKAQQQCVGNLVQYNTIDATATAETYSCAGIALCLDTRYGGYDLLDGTEDVSGNQILDNPITASGANNGVGIEVGTILGNSEDDPDRTNPDKIAVLMAATAVRDNLVQGNNIDGAETGIYFYNVTDLTITQNEIINSVDKGIYVEHGHSGVAVNYNNIYGNAYGLENDDKDVDYGSIDATNNWWGHASGPSRELTNGKWVGKKGDKVSENVDYKPWLHKSEEDVVDKKKPAYAQSIVLDNTGEYGWNTFSTPIFLDYDADTWAEMYDLAELAYSLAYRFDSDNQTFVPLTTTDEYAINPGEGFFIKMDDVGSLAILYSTEENLMPPSRPLTAGWNLIGLASLEDMLVEDAFFSLAGEGQVVSPTGNESPGAVLTGDTVYVGESYWVYMLGERTLAGFTTTPVEWVP